MKIIVSSVAAIVALEAVSCNADTTQRQLNLGGGTVPTGTKTYTVGIRPTVDGDNFCGGSLITPTYVLTTTVCTSYEEPNLVSVGGHYINGTKDGEQIKVVSAVNHTDFNTTSAAHDFAILKLEKPSKFIPVKLPAADDSDIIPGMWATTMGWGDTSYPNGSRSYELQRVGLEVWSNEDCSEVFGVDNSTVCAGGVAGKDSCIGDSGGPLIKEKAKGDADDVLIGLVSWGYHCGEKGYPAVYSRVSTAIDWINSVIQGQ